MVIQKREEEEGEDEKQQNVASHTQAEICM